MKKIVFFEVNFGSQKLIPLMTVKCFSSFDSAFFYAKQIRDAVINKLESSEATLKADDFVNLGVRDDCEWCLVFENKYFHLDIYQIRVISHFYILED